MKNEAKREEEAGAGQIFFPFVGKIAFQQQRDSRELETKDRLSCDGDRAIAVDRCGMHKD